MLTLRWYGFHGWKELRLKAKPGDVLTPAQVRRFEKAACPFDDCYCLGVIGCKWPETGPRLEREDFDTYRVEMR